MDGGPPNVGCPDWVKVDGADGDGIHLMTARILARVMGLVARALQSEWRTSKERAVWGRVEEGWHVQSGMYV